MRTVTLPHLQLFGVSEGLELRVSHMEESIICVSSMLNCHSDQEARKSTSWRWRSAVPMSYREAIEDTELR